MIALFGIVVLVHVSNMAQGIPDDLCMIKTLLAHEDALLGTCTKSCEEVGSLHGVGGCDMVDSCIKKHDGWVRGFVRCDYCECMCWSKCPHNYNCPFRLGDTVKMDFLESDLKNGSCSGKCFTIDEVDNVGGCKKVSNCVFRRRGWNSGFVRCDFCTCDCELPDNIRPGMQLRTIPGHCVP